MLTADTITDEQIRELQNIANACTEMACSTCHEIWRATQVALDGLKPDRRNARTVARARARCAEILNARNMDVSRT